jgi:hypothetical protein
VKQRARQQRMAATALAPQQQQGRRRRQRPAASTPGDSQPSTGPSISTKLRPASASTPSAWLSSDSARGWRAGAASSSCARRPAGPAAHSPRRRCASRTGARGCRPSAGRTPPRPPGPTRRPACACAPVVVKTVRQQAERTGHEQGRARPLQQARRRQEMPAGAAPHRTEPSMNTPRPPWYTVFGP